MPVSFFKLPLYAAKYRKGTYEDSLRKPSSLDFMHDRECIQQDYRKNIRPKIKGKSLLQVKMSALCFQHKISTEPYYSPTRLHAGQARQCRQQSVARSIAESDAGRDATGRHCRERRASHICKKRALASAKALFIKSGDYLLSHKSLQYHRPKLNEGD